MWLFSVVGMVVVVFVGCWLLVVVVVNILLNILVTYYYFLDMGLN